MAQPVDFIGLNTFIYEPSGWFIEEQTRTQPIDAIPVNQITVVEPHEYNKSSMLQNTMGSHYSIFFERPPNSFMFVQVVRKDIKAYRNYDFPLQLPDPQTNAAPTNSTEATRATASYFSALMSKRNGPYGWPTWKQIRVSDNPITRRQKKEGIFT